MLPPTLLSLTAALLTLLPSGTHAASSSPNPKRGLVYVPNDRWPQDNYIWTRPPTPLTWYYNYGSRPSVVFNNLSQDALQFVPMMWGAPADLTDTTFLQEVREVLKTRKLSHVMGFNEPDGLPEWGSSAISPAVAAQVWVRNIIPLQTENNLKAGLPAPTGGWGGVPWLKQFLGNCSAIISQGSSTTKNCTFDFVPIHWYGPFEGLASHIGTYSAAFPNTSIWVTEWNFNDQGLEATQSFVKMSLEYMDRIPDVERYSIFASFRSQVSNVGPNGAMLNKGGELTDIGKLYLGQSGQGASPDSGSGGARRFGSDGLVGAMVVACAAALMVL